MRRIEVLGQRFKRLTVLRELPNRRNPNGESRRWCLCRCDCGKEVVIQVGKLLSGNTGSCGCLSRDTTRKRSLKHGHNRAGEYNSTYKSWSHMKDRCLNPRNKSYSYYGGRGITVCDRWLDYANFLEDMGEKPKGMSIDRINNDGNYEPDNCRWANAKQQNRNKRWNVWIEFQGRRMILTDWAKLIGISRMGLVRRLNEWSLADALTKPKEN